jgi:acyl transferase domain-containing protein/phosphopantetheinyl transferase
MSTRRPSQIAIIGMGCRFAGGADLSTFFENILALRDCIREVPGDRWSKQTFCDPASAASDRISSCRGGYLDSPIRFNAADYGIMPRTVEGGEPEQFLVLDTTVAALADAGLTVSDLAGRRVEVVIGRGNYFNRGNLTRLQHGRVMAQTLALLSAFFPEWSEAELDAIRADLRAALPPFEAATIPGQLTNATAGRIASRLDLNGASYVVDAASASSLVALDLAIRALLERRADLAIAGGVYLEADVDFPLVFRQLNALSPSGTSRPFAAGADGMVPGEGAGAVILKRRIDAERDGDRIYALVQGVGVASDGRGRGLAAPSARGHARAMRRAYRQSGIDPSTVMLVEGHGLGVPAADRAELRALKAIFPPSPNRRRFLGAVSSMIGHAMPAAGMAGLIKTALALHHRVLPPTLHAEEPHSMLDEPKSAFVLNSSARPWIHAEEDTPRRAGVNAFGFAGINAHAVLEEHVASVDGAGPGALRNWETEAILLWASDRGGLIERARELLDWLKRSPREALRDVAYSVNSLRGHAPGGARLGLVAASLDDLAQRLEAVVPRLANTGTREIRDGRGVYYWDEPLYAAGAPRLAFLFPGEGSQYPGMLADMCVHFPEVRRLFDAADRIARELGATTPPSEHVFGHAHQADEKLWSAATGVNVVLNAQWALYQVLTRLGLKPDAVVGHSSGELLALAAAGAFDTDRALERKLGRLGAFFRGLECSGDLPVARLIAVATHRDRLEALCRAAGATGAAVAMDNCPHQVVLAVPPQQVEPLLGRLRQENILWEDLPFDRAYHTPAFRSVLGPIIDFFADLTFRAPRLPIYSCASKQQMPQGLDSIRELAVAQWTRTVSFRETIETMHDDGLRVFVDVGARGNLAGFVEDILRGKPALAMAANVPRRSGLTQLNHLVAATFAQGIPIEPEYLYARRAPRAIDWSAPERTPPTLVELRVGFPEMRLSERLLKKLRPENCVSAPREAADSPPPHHHAGAGDYPGNDQSDGNGAASRGRAVASIDARVAACDRWPRREVELDFAPALEPISPRANGDMERADSDTEPAVPEFDGAMLSFQETMQAFLRTQHTIMAAYLGSPISNHSDLHSSSEVFPQPTASSSGASIDRTGWEESALSQEREEPCSPHAAASGAVPANGMQDDSCLLRPRAGDRAPIVSGPIPGPWAGEVRRLIPAFEIETVIFLDARNDPIAEHHTLGGRLVSASDPSLRGLPVLPFAVMAEMTAQAAALAVTPGLVLTGLHQARAHKWVRYEQEPVCLEVRGHHVRSNADERVWVGIFNRGTGGDAEAPRPVFEAIVAFSESTPPAQPQSPWSLENARPSRFTSKSVYEEQWLFHGSTFQAIEGVGRISEQGIEGTVRVLPLEPLLGGDQPALFHTDLIVIDTFTQLLGCWGLGYLTEGDVVFPLSMEELEIQGDPVPPGAVVDCRITVKEIHRRKLLVQAEIIRPDGTIWMRISDWQDWRFHWPGRYRDVFRQPRDYFAGEELALDALAGRAVLHASAVWLEPPADMGRPVWRDVLEQTQLGPRERAEFLCSSGSDRRRTYRLWGRIAAKEAARRLWQAAGYPATYPADLAITDGDGGRPRLAHVVESDDRPPPSISIADCEGVAVALAALDPVARPGIEVSLIVDRDETFLASAFTLSERSLLEECAGTSRMEWVARLYCAKQAAVKAVGVAALSRVTAEVLRFDQHTGVVCVRITSDGNVAAADPVVDCLSVVSARRAGSAWAWTLGQGA